MIKDTSMQDTLLPGPTDARKRWRPKLLIAGLLALGLAVAVVFPEIQRWSSSSLTIDATRLRLATVQRGEFIRDVSVQGKVVAAIRPMLFSPQDGRVTTLVRAGDTVRKNDVLAVIESPELLSDFKQEQSTLQKLEAELSRQEIATRMAQLEHNKSVTLSEMALIAANRELRRAEIAHQQNAISAQDYEKAIDDRNRAAAVSRHKGEEASLKTEQLKLELDILNHALNRQKLLVMELDRKIAALSVLSPVDGVVGNLEVEQKSIVARYQKIMSVVDMSAYEVEARVPETYADELAQGMAVDIDLSGEHFTGELSAISPEVENGQVRCRIRFVDEKPSGLRQNQRVASRIFLDSRDGVLMVARGPFMQSGSRGYAYVVEDGMAIKTPIVAGMTSAGRVEILSGLKEGQEIVISSSDVFDRHERVLLINQNSPQQES